MHIPEDVLLLDFIQYLRFEKRYSDHTIRAYQDDISSFKDFIRVEFETDDLKDASVSFVRTWLSTLKEGKNSLGARSIGRKLSSLRSFYKYLLKKGFIRISPVANLSAPKVGKKLPVYVESDKAEELFARNSFGDGWRALTTELILKLLYQTGMRRSELVNLKSSQIDNYNYQLRVVGKGNKERIIPVNKDILESISAYEAGKAGRWEQFDKQHLLLTEKGNPLYAQYVYRIVREYLKDFTTLSKRSPHILRHSFATHLLNNGADLNAVKELLGHSSLAATQVYTHTTIGKLREIHKKAHPKG
ncbi:tyrosine-type recombinase/integrase [Flavihumibacter sp.]|uniref:tyrosine-type recombinase/integrase n=1 Tax=Flavihumibacter sp. TaxID=1913981 RepID=UPI002FC895BB